MKTDLWRQANLSLTDKVMKSCTDKHYTEEQKEKIKYAWMIVFSECEKFMLLLILFGLIGRATDFLWLFLMSSTIHVFVGGSHQKNTGMCFFYSTLFFCGIIYLASVAEMGEKMIAVSTVVYGGVIAICGPVLSSLRGNYGEKKRMRFQINALLMLLIWSEIVAWIPRIRFLFGWMLLFQMADYFGARWKERRKNENIRLR